MKYINIKNENFSLLFYYFNDKHNKNSLIKVFDKGNYELTLKYLNENYENSIGNNKKMKIYMLDKKMQKKNIMKLLIKIIKKIIIRIY